MSELAQTSRLVAAVQGHWWAFRRMPARPLGKVTTVAQFALILSLLMPWPLLRDSVLAVTVGISLFAAGDYFGRLMKAVHDRG